ncbi:MAG TPA: DUF411 domain-containing protein [Mesorhizobium sp.]|jgi:hypothetical protein|nr:DUF411 domain-containing protein [Mesorhizobium sp.]
MRLAVPALVAATLLSAPAAQADHSRRHMTVFKTPGCECCSAWAAIAREHGFEVTLEEREDMEAIKDRLGVVEAVRSCHTTSVDGYVVEGHVPMTAVKKLLSERPRVTGIGAPGMPMGSPGMGDDPRARFDVLSFGGTQPHARAVFFEAGKD